MTLGREHHRKLADEKLNKDLKCENMTVLVLSSYSKQHSRWHITGAHKSLPSE